MEALSKGTVTSWELFNDAGEEFGWHRWIHDIEERIAGRFTHDFCSFCFD